MYAVIFEVTPKVSGKPEYLEIARRLRPMLEGRPGFISAERFQSLSNENAILSLSFWESEAAIAAWKSEVSHAMAQKLGREQLFESYRIRVAKVERDYCMA